MGVCMIDEITKSINETSQRIADAINESNLHPSIVLLILQNTANEVTRLLESLPKQEENNAECES